MHWKTKDPKSVALEPFAQRTKVLFAWVPTVLSDGNTVWLGRYAARQLFCLPGDEKEPRDQLSLERYFDEEFPKAEYIENCVWVTLETAL